MNTKSEASLRKSDVPWYLKNPYCQAVFYIGAAAILLGVYIDPEFSQLRPGVLNGLIGLTLGTLFGRLAGKYMVYEIQDSLPEQGLGIWLPVHHPRINRNRLVFIISFFGALLGAACLSSVIYGAIHPQWSGTGESITGGAIICAHAAFMCTTANAVGRWYRSLPE